MKNIQYLGIQNNSLTGTLPAIKAGSSALVSVRLGYNELTGCAATPLLSVSLHAQKAAAIVHVAVVVHLRTTAAGACRPPGHR